MNSYMLEIEMKDQQKKMEEEALQFAMLTTVRDKGHSPSGILQRIKLSFLIYVGFIIADLKPSNLHLMQREGFNLN